MSSTVRIADHVVLRAKSQTNIQTADAGSLALRRLPALRVDAADSCDRLSLGFRRGCNYSRIAA
jgi:hypothetical protein